MADYIFNQNKPFDPGEAMTPSVQDEIRTWTPLLEVLCNGIVKPHNPVFIIDQLTKLEKRIGSDLSDMKKCCPTDGVIREASSFKPLIESIVERIILISDLKVSNEQR